MICEKCGRDINEIGQDNCSPLCGYPVCEDCEIFAFVKEQDNKIFALENRLKECENGYEGTLFLDRCKLHDAEEKIKELTEENENAREKNKWLNEENERLHASCTELTRNLEIANLEIECKERILESYMMQYGTVADKEVFLKKERADTVRKVVARAKEKLRSGNVIMDKSIADIIDQIAKEIADE